jgi:hypothetical protein
MATPHTLLMLRPNNFGFNSETKFSNPFQNNIKEDKNVIKSIAQNEFDIMVKTLQNNDINVKIFADSENPLPDSVFMNNWISIFPDGKLVIYPMFTENRRRERRSLIIDEIIEKFDITGLIDLTHYENDNQFLEGTGSCVFDHINKLVFTCKSPRSNEKVFNELCDRVGYQGFYFNSVDLNGVPIYHTNVMMSIFKKQVIICADSIENNLEKNIVITALKNTGREIIYLTYNQLNNYTANSFEVTDIHGKSKIIMSRTAYSSLTEPQLIKLTTFSEIIPVNISIIERVGGGSARCMLTGVSC